MPFQLLGQPDLKVKVLIKSFNWMLVFKHSLYTYMFIFLKCLTHTNTSLALLHAPFKMYN